MAGKGNNGGDAFVAARHLKKEKIDTKIVLIGSSKDLRTEEARRNCQILKAGGYEIKEITDSSELKTRETLLDSSDVIVDAIFGTGVRGRIREPEATAIDIINHAKANSNAFIVAVDIPSGLDADTGSPPGDCIRADATLTLALPKVGMLEDNASKYLGKLYVGDISVPARLLREMGIEVKDIFASSSILKIS